MTDQSNYYFWQYASDGTDTDDFGRPQAWLWGDNEDDVSNEWCFRPGDYVTATAYVVDALERLVTLRRNSGSTGSHALPSPEQFHDMILDVADAFATDRRVSNDA